MSGYLAELHAAHVERRQRIAVAARAYAVRDLGFKVTRATVGPDERCACCKPARWMPILRPSVKGIITVTCAYFGVDVRDMLGPGRRQELVYPRYLAAYISRTDLNVGYLTLGPKFNRDHSTIVHAVEWVKQRLHEPAIQADLAAVRQRVRGG